MTTGGIMQMIIRILREISNMTHMIARELTAPATVLKWLD